MIKKSNPVVLWGSTGHSKVLHECLLQQGYEVVALFDNNESVITSIPGVPLFYGDKGFKNWLEYYPDRHHVSCLVAIGGSRGKDRVKIQTYLRTPGLEPLIAIHPTAFVANNVKIGLGSQVLAQTAVCAEAVLGEACIINTSASIDHECRLEEGVHVAPGAHLAGEVTVGPYAMIGTGATVLSRVRIGEGAIVGAGAVVVRNVPAYAVVVGCPAQWIKNVNQT